MIKISRNLSNSNKSMVNIKNYVETNFINEYNEFKMTNSNQFELNFRHPMYVYDFIIKFAPISEG